MALYDDNLDNLIEKTCKLLLHDWWEGTVTTGGTGTITDTSRVEAADFFNDKNAELYMRTGTCKEDTRTISDFGSNVITFTPNFSGTAAVGDTYSIHAEFKRDEVKEAINASINMVAKEALIWKRDETSVVLASDVYEYDMPDGFVYINRLTMMDANGNFYGEPVPPEQYLIVKGNPCRIKFPTMPSDQQYTDHWWGDLWSQSDLTDAYRVRIEGLGRQDELVEDMDICHINPVYVMYQAAALLHMSRSERGENDPKDHAGQAIKCQQRADIERKRATDIRVPPDSKRVSE